MSKRSSGFAIAPETSDGAFWYGSFDVGDAKNLSLLIDTGSADVAVNPGLYIASSRSQNLTKFGTLGYSTTEANGCGTANISYSEVRDRVAFAGNLSTDQVIGSVISKTPPNSGTITALPGQGIVGFSGVSANGTQLNATPWFWNLCEHGVVAECRFGLALHSDGTGSQVLGGVDDSLYDGTLDTAASQAYAWEIAGGITVNNSVVENSSQVILDSGTANIVGPVDSVRDLFTKAGIQAVEQNLPGCTSSLFGYYNCSAPPQIGLVFGNGTQVYNVEPSAFKLADNGNDNCTATVTGIDFSEPIWIVGQAWFQGKYVDFQQGVDNASVGVAPLKGSTNYSTIELQNSGASDLKGSAILAGMFTAAMMTFWTLAM